VGIHAVANAIPTPARKPRAEHPSRAAVLARLLGPALAATARLAARRHPDLFERLAAIPDPTFALVPDELPVAVVVRADTRRPRMYAVAKLDLDPTRVAAVVRGPLRRLAALADGRLDGDTLFFSREIAIEGSTEAAVALRNALDNAELGGLAELVLPRGPATALAQRLLRLGGGILESLHARSLRRRAAA
jgi:predicted lipid carrier protein YhbT